MSLVAHTTLCNVFHTETSPLSSPQTSRSISSTHASFPNSNTFHAPCTFFSKQFRSPLFVSCRNNDADAHDISDSDSGSSKVNYHGSSQTNRFTSTKLLEKLRKYGISGILSYGILNTVYYLTTFSFVWFYVAPSPGRMGYAAAVERFVKVMAMVWVGSQVTKLARAAGALAFAPLVSRGLTWFTAKFNFQSEGKAFMAVVGACFGMAFLLFLLVTLLWA